MEKTLRFIGILCAVVVFLFTSSCSNIPAIDGATPSPSAKSGSLPTEFAHIEDEPWTSTTIIDEQNVLIINNPGEGFSGRPISNSQVKINQITRWKFKLKVNPESESSGVIIEGQKSDVSQPKIYLGCTSGQWSLGYAPHTNNYVYWQNLTQVKGIEQEFVITISADRKTLEVQNNSIVVLSEIFPDVLFPNDIDLNSFIQFGPQSEIEVSSFLIEQKEDLNPTDYALAQDSSDPMLEEFSVKDIQISLPGEGIPSDLEIISADNVEKLEQIAVYGPGTYYDKYYWSPSQKLFAVEREAGFEVFDITSGQTLGAVPNYSDSTLLGFTTEDNLLFQIKKPLGTFLVLYSIPQREYISSIGYQSSQIKINADQTLAAEDGSGKIGIWDLKTGMRMNTVDIEDQSILYWLSPSGDKFATIGEDSNTVTLWSSMDGQKITQIILDQPYLEENTENHQIAIHILQGGQRILAQKDNFIKVWDLSDRSRISSFDIGSEFNFFAFSENEKIMVTTKDKEIFNFWDIESGTMISSIDAGHVRSDCTYKSIFTSDNSKFVTFQYRNEAKYCGYGDNLLTIWNISDGSKFALFAIKPNSTYFESPSGKFLVPFSDSSANSGPLVFGNLQDGSHLVVDYLNRDNMKVAVSPDDSHVAVFSANATADGQLVTGYTLKIGDLSSGKLIKVAIPSDWMRVHALNFSPDGSMIAVSSDDNWNNDGLELCSGVAFWDLNGEFINNICFTDGLFDEIQFSKDSQHLLLFHANTCQTYEDQKSITLQTGEFSDVKSDIEWVWPMSTGGCLPLEIGGLSAGNYNLQWGENWVLTDNQGHILFDNLGEGNGYLPALSKSGDVVFFSQLAPDGWRRKLAWLNTSDLTIHAISPEFFLDRNVFLLYRQQKETSSYYFPNYSLNKIMLSPDGKILATINRGTVILWGVRN